jgi:signal peptidase II
MRGYLAIIAAAATLILDQCSKLAVRTHLALGESMPVLDPVLQLTYIENRGAAFGILEGKSLFFVAVTLAVLAFLVVYVYKEASNSRLAAYGTALVVGGALGNLIDRIMKGSVTDMFDLRVWPIFNVADIAVCVGFGLLVIYLLFYSDRKDGAHAD